MSSYCRMERAFLRGVLWLYLLGFGYMALSLEPGFLDFDNLPDTNFTCVGKVIGGYYADLETNCQMFHVCTIGQMDEPMDIRFLCLNGTVFDQETRVCERIDEVDCSKSEQFYSLNLELYGNSQPSILEENPETEQPLIIKSSTTAKPPTTQTNIKTTPGPYYTSSASPSVASLSGGNPAGESNTITSHHFPLINRNSPDIRFNPEEINISLHPGAPPDIRTNSAYRRQQEFGEKKSSRGSSLQVGSSTDKVVHSESTSKAQVRYNSAPSSSDINYEINYGQEDSSELEDLPHQDFQYHREGYQPEKYSGHLQPFKSSTYRNEFTHSTSKIDGYHLLTPTTGKNIFLQSLKPPSPDEQSHYGDFRTEKPPQRLQLPLPLLPTLPPLTFSTPAPFALHPHIETKRYTKEHLSPPRIIISASASVSDASGRRLNYSLGTIGAQILQQPPTSYDEYREGDVGLDPFYHDVPKIKGSTRKKRSTEDKKVKPTDIIENEQQAVEILKFLFDWYRNDKTNPAKITTPLTSAGISEINTELAPVTVLKFQDDKAVETNSSLTDSFDRNSSHNNNDEKSHKRHNQSEISNSDNMFLQHEGDYVDDNYEPIVFGQNGEREEPVKTATNHNEKHKNLKIPEDYVDDNVEPLYYNERNKNDTVTETQEKHSDSEEAKYKIIDIDKAIEKLETHHTPSDVLESTNEDDYITESQTPSNSHLNQSNDNIHHNSVPHGDNNDNNTTVQNKKPLNNITHKLKKNRRRGRRKHIDPNKESNRDNIDFKAILIEKLIERPYRAKDDYDYLKTVSNVISSTVKTQNLEPIENESNKDIILPNNSEYNNSADMIHNSESIELPTSAEPLTVPTLPLTVPASGISASTAKSNYRNSRRGKQRYNSGEDKVPHRFRIRNQHSRSTSTAISGNDVHNKETDVAHNTHIVEHQSNIFDNIPLIGTAQTTPSYGTSNLNNDMHIIVNLGETHTDDEHLITSTTESSEKDTAVKEKDHIVQKFATATENGSNFYVQSTETLHDFLENNNITAISVDIIDNDVIAPKDVEDGLQYETESKIAPLEKNPLIDKNRTVSHSQTKIELYKHLSFEDENQTNTVSIISSDENTSESQMNSRYSTVHETTTEAETITQEHLQDPENPENNYIKTGSDNILYESTTLTNEVGSEEFQTIDYREDSDKSVQSNNSLSEIIETNYSNAKPQHINTDSITYDFTTSINNLGNDYEINNSKNVLDINVKTNNSIDKISEPYDNYSNLRHQHTKTGSILYGSTMLTNNPKKDEYQTINYGGDSDLHVNSLLPLETTTPLYDVELYTSPQNDSSYLLSKHKNVDRFEKEDINNKQQKNIQYNYITSTTATTDFYRKSNELIQVQSTLPIEITETSYNQQDDILTETETTTEKMKIEERNNLPHYYENIEITTSFLLETGINKEGYYTNLQDGVKEEYESHTHEESTIKLETTTLNMEVSTDTEVPTTVELATTQMFPDTSLLPETTTTTTNVPDIRITHRRKSRRKGIRPSRIQSSPYSRYRHRFSTYQSTNHPITSENSRYESGYHQQEYYSDEVSTEAPLKNNTNHPVTSENSRYKIGYHQQEYNLEELSTEAPLKKNAIPTKSEQAQDKSIPTTPLSKTTVKKHYFFNCFNKGLDKFYPDPRDCRLFHYCTQGYTKNQLLDLKFVCDLNTFFDDKSLICTKEKPTRCL